ncbi:MAG TPA: cytochrome C oxidase subunit IV family protein [Pyrinomonadaceae bacterium]|nr:cytochrome C oxidase subunit IV family protein [Pyrinomonadaceae bacterium]
MSEHIVSKKLYFVIFGALMVLTVLTVVAANYDLGSEKINTVVALAIATTKAVLVVLYFMHVRYSSRLTWVVVAGGFLWLIIMVGLTMSDYLTRGFLTYPR